MRNTRKNQTKQKVLNDLCKVEEDIHLGAARVCFVHLVMAAEGLFRAMENPQQKDQVTHGLHTPVHPRSTVFLRIHHRGDREDKERVRYSERFSKRGPECYLDQRNTTEFGPKDQSLIIETKQRRT